MAALTTNNIVYAGTAPTFESAALSDTAEVGKNKFAVYKNTDASTRTVTIDVPTGNTPYTEKDPDVEYTLAANTGELWIPLHSDYDDGTGRCTITVSAIAGVTVAIVHAGWVE
ncbi:hypothetical protein BJP40_06705 [Streptomyces sp. CC53]|uniref:hypothetical protein n=1 Tax=Streptomyces sp. CC53 TaxID=1906740 RepID=UPI0008DDE9A8|nr:hypothetical protein [Streptomyces sp. CC53]OII61211.1 hypothetical protein BJP40_06705 [Streptomyces sp. CC53]